MAVAYRKTSLGGRHIRERWGQASATNTAQTCTTDPAVSTRCPGVPRELRAVFVNYDAAVTKDITITLNSGVGTEYDVLLKTIALTDEQFGFWLPEEPIPFMEDDTIDVYAPAGGTDRESQIIILTECEEF